MEDPYCEWSLPEELLLWVSVGYGLVNVKDMTVH